MSSIRIKAPIRVPKGKTCHYENTLSCDFMKHGSANDYCIAFDEAPIFPTDGEYYRQKCPACLKACEETEER